MSVSIVVDYSNGAIKSYGGVALSGGPHHSVMGALRAAGSGGPGLEVDFAAASTDRGGREIGSITSVDGLPGDDSDKVWQVFVNGSRVREQREPVPGQPTQEAIPAINDGDQICLKLVVPEAD